MSKYFLLLHIYYKTIVILHFEKVKKVEFYSRLFPVCGAMQTTVENSGKNKTHGNGNDEVEDHCQNEGKGENHNVLDGRFFADADEMAPFAHIISNDEQHGSNGRHRDPSGKGH